MDIQLFEKLNNLIEGVIDKTISHHYGNIRSFLKDVRGSFTSSNRITYREMINVISKDKDLSVGAEEKPVDSSRPFGKTSIEYLVKLNGKKLRAIPKEVYDGVQASAEG